MATKYYFDGVEQYIEIPAYSTLGNPDVYRTLSYGTDNEDGFITDGVEPITEIGRVGSNHHEGTIFDLRFTDISPIQNTTANEGDDVIFLTAPIIVIEGGFQITFDWKRTGAGSSFTLFTGKNSLQTVTNSIVINAGDDLVVTDLNGTVSTVTDAFAGVANGQHCHVKIRAVEDIDLEEGETNNDLNNLIVFVDGIETGRVSVPNLDYLLRLEATGVLPDGMVIQNLGVGPDGIESTWVLPLAEGTGTTAYNTNTVTRNKLYATNIQPFSNDLTVEVGTEPPPPPPPPPTGDRQGVIYFSGAETGAIQPRGNAIDGWGGADGSHPIYGDQQITVVTDSSFAKAGNRCIRTYYDYYNWGLDTGGNIRSEIYRPGGIQLLHGNEYWIGWAFRINDNANNRYAVTRDRQNCHCSQWHLTTTATSGINMRNGLFMFKFGSMSNPESTFNNEVPIGTIPFGRWVTFVMHVRISSGSDGFCKVWIDATAPTDPMVYNKTGRTLIASSEWLNIKQGIYWNKEPVSWDFSKVRYLEHFYDEYRIAVGSSANFYSVVPD